MDVAWILATEKPDLEGMFLKSSRVERKKVIGTWDPSFVSE